MDIQTKKYGQALMMKSRFEGQEGRSRLVHALTMQSIVDGAESLAEQIADEVEIIGY